MGKRKEQGNRKASLPQMELQGTIDNQTEIIINEYLATKQDEDTKRTYSDALKLLFRYTPFNQKPLDQFTVNDMNTFIDMLKQYNYSNSRIDMYISVMCDMKSYVQKWYSDIYRPDFMHGLENLHLPINRRETPHFDLATLGKIRELIKDNIGLKYVFELVIQLGIDKKNIEKCLPQNANRFL